MKLQSFCTAKETINKMKIQPSEWIKDLNVRLETVKLPEENIDRPLFDIYHSNIFLDLTPQAKETKIK